MLAGIDQERRDLGGRPRENIPPLVCVVRMHLSRPDPLLDSLASPRQNGRILHHLLGDHRVHRDAPFLAEAMPIQLRHDP